ncbi:DNA gyrase inhibitor YacG [Ideonella azotifigens]|uniref:DNA gyrase inhibitor YacG n=1 Tax=Ideonella azotifigens TaxID=513160 RepID=UPI001476BE09|nr:DNA gyrase inhibitor YacG [Ideonella azotifigens]MCD2339491.1 DNA gyrase inhibitor YacG [Ideonella azotifigens]
MNQPKSSPPSSVAAKAIEVNCPACGERTLYSPANAFRPFCSARCQGHDFGAWANEGYRVPTKPSSEEPEP